MNTYRNERRDLLDGRAFLTMTATMPLKLIANIANVSEAEVTRLIELARSKPQSE